MMTPKKITVIPAGPKFMEKDIRKQYLRVAPYCRVSTDKEEQLASYETQMAYYTEKIAANKDWTMVRLYADASVKIGLRQKTLTARGFWLSPVTFLRHRRPYRK